LEAVATASPIPDYWSKVLKACSRLSQDVFPEDEPLLKHITTIHHLPEEEGNNFTIRFTFSPNDFFTNDKLEVKFFMIDENEPEKCQLLEEIKWKEGKNITKKSIEKK